MIKQEVRNLFELNAQKEIRNEQEYYERLLKIE